MLSPSLQVVSDIKGFLSVMNATQLYECNHAMGDIFSVALLLQKNKGVLV